ncbi:sigma 54-interacting transcriptional regulator [Fibrobacterota bacterium]
MKVLIIDSDEQFKENLISSWSVSGIEFLESEGGGRAIRQISKGNIGAVFLSTDFLTIDNLDILTLIREHNPGVEIFILSERKDTSKAEEAVRKGAHSFLVRPISLPLVETLIKKVISRALARKNHRILEDHLMTDLLGSTPAMEKILTTIAKVAPTNSNILIEGETGTGKEFIANLVHRMSSRADDPFVTVNCAAIPENLIESELFGSKRGAFTGAVSDRKGLFEEADTGTLFLDEIGELPTSLQVKLLRFLQQKEIRKVGENESRIVDVRVIAATNLNLIQAVADGKFREDLYYRLNIFHLRLPPLRERRVNLPHLIRFFVKKYSSDNNKLIKGMAREAEARLLNYNYPGNIRELENIIEHSVVLCEGEYILKSHLPDHIADDTGFSELLSLPVSDDLSSNPNTIQSLSQVEKNHIVNSLRILNNNQTEVARRLGISRSTLWRKMKEHRISV